MKLDSKICQICQKLKGNNGINHEKCSRQLQQMNINKKRIPAPAKLSTRKADTFASLILRTTA